ncbi:MAG: hypothetical protein U0790_24945 [Isosphaeraceae bacterium]
MSRRREYGDFQTPPELARAALATLGPIRRRWTRVLEPTCGTGSFLIAAIQPDRAPRELIGIDIDPAHCEAARSALLGCPDCSVRILESSVFALDLGRDLPWTKDGPLLVVGNPPG